MPNIVAYLNFFGYTVYNFNGYVLPFMMFIEILRRKGNKNIFKMILGYVGLIFFILLGVICACLRMYNLTLPEDQKILNG